MKRCTWVTKQGICDKPTTGTMTWPVAIGKRTEQVTQSVCDQHRVLIMRAAKTYTWRAGVQEDE